MACRIIRHCQIADGGKQLCRRLALVHRQQVGQSRTRHRVIHRQGSSETRQASPPRPSDETEPQRPLRGRADRGGPAGGRSLNIARAIALIRLILVTLAVVATGGCVRHHHLRDGAGSGAGGFGRSACVYRRSNGARRISATSGYKGSDDRRAGSVKRSCHGG
jgi:hypothetical protein